MFPNPYYLRSWTFDHAEETILSEDIEPMCDFSSHSDIEKIRERVKDSKFICEDCGRAANKKEYLCSPVDL